MITAITIKAQVDGVYSNKTISTDVTKPMCLVSIYDGREKIADIFATAVNGKIVFDKNQCPQLGYIEASKGKVFTIQVYFPSFMKDSILFNYEGMQLSMQYLEWDKNGNCISMKGLQDGVKTINGNEKIISSLIPEIVNGKFIIELEKLGKVSIILRRRYGETLLGFEKNTLSYASVNKLNKYGVMPLFVAIQNDMIQTAEYLIKCGASINFVNSDGNSPLSLCSYKKNYQNHLAKILLEKGANPSIVNKDGDFPLALAAHNQNIELVKLLLLYKAKINMQDSDGQTALIYAARWENKEIITLLIKNGASLIIKDKNGKTALDWAESEEIRTLLQTKPVVK